MSGIKIYIKSKEEKDKLINDYLAPDDMYLKSIDDLKAELVAEGVDLNSAEGKKRFVLALRELNRRFGNDLERELPQS